MSLYLEKYASRFSMSSPKIFFDILLEIPSLKIYLFYTKKLDLKLKKNFFFLLLLFQQQMALEIQTPWED